MSGCNIYDEILSKKNRRPQIESLLIGPLRGSSESKRWLLVADRLHQIMQVHHLLKLLEGARNSDECEEVELVEKIADTYWNTGTELVKYIPIGLVACIEGFFRLAYTDLINSGPPYRYNSLKFDESKDYSLKKHFELEQRSISLGEYLAHKFPTSSLKHINSNMSRLIDDCFLSRFKQICPTLIDMPMPLFPGNDIGEPEKEISNAILADINRLFYLRHIFCHEISPGLPMNYTGFAYGAVESALAFLRISDTIVDDLLSDVNST